jgi:hypothetical protein
MFSLTLVLTSLVTFCWSGSLLIKPPRLLVCYEVVVFVFLCSAHLTSGGGGVKHLGKSMQSQNTQALFIRRGIKATVGQLDRWESDQLALQLRRELANSRFPHGVKDRLALARHRAGSGKTGLRTVTFVTPPVTHQTLAKSRKTSLSRQNRNSKTQLRPSIGLLSIVFIYKLAIFIDPPTLCFIQARLGKKAQVIQPRKFLLRRLPVLTTSLCPSDTLSKISRLPQE